MTRTIIKEQTNRPVKSPRKLVRDKNPEHCKAKGVKAEHEVISDRQEIRRLFRLKIMEELQEIQDSGHKDINEFADLVQAAVSYARMSGHTFDDLFDAIMDKKRKLGAFSNVVLTTLNPDNPSNRVYFDEFLKDKLIALSQDTSQDVS